MTITRSRFALAVLAIVFASGFFGFLVNGAAVPVPSQSVELPPAVLVKVKPGVNAEQNIRQSLQQFAVFQARTVTIGNAVQYLMDGALSPVLSTIDVQRLTPSNRSVLADGLDRWYVVENGGIDSTSVASWLDAQSWVEAAELDERYAISKTAANDPYYSRTGSWGQSYADQWGLERLRVSDVWKKTSGDPSLVVAVIDTGVDGAHPELSGRMWTNINEIPGNNTDDDGDGLVDDVRGWNFIDASNNPIDDHGHGTHVAGIIGAASNNRQGIASVAWQPKIMSLKALDHTGSGRWSWGAAAIVYAADHGADVINMSWGGSRASQLIFDVVSYANQQGVILVAAAGNDWSDRPHYPSAMPHVISVGAWSPDNRRAWFSNFGPTVDVFAPGVDILSLRASGTDMYGDGLKIVDSLYYRASGTSMSAPLVAGISALLRSEYPRAPSGLFEIAMDLSAEDFGPVGRDDGYGFGVVRPAKALSTLKKIQRDRTAELSVSFPSAWAYWGEPVRVKAVLSNTGSADVLSVGFRVVNTSNGQDILRGARDIKHGTDVVLDITLPDHTMNSTYQIEIDPDNVEDEYFQYNNSAIAQLVLKHRDECPPPCN